MAKLNLKVTSCYLDRHEIRIGRLFKAGIDKLDRVYIRIYCHAELKVKRLYLTKSDCGVIQHVHCDEVLAEFVPVKTKTIACKKVDHKAGGKKSFKEGKRYIIEQGRALGAVAGAVFDEDGDRWHLMREDVGFSCGGGTYLFEAKYS